MPPSKTARRSTPGGSSGAFITDPGVNRLIPLDEGRHAYVLHADGRMGRYAVDSEAFTAAVGALVTSLGAERVRRDLDARIAGPVPQWSAVVERLEGAGAFDPAGGTDA
jgi:hypothetical protein